MLRLILLLIIGLTDAAIIVTQTLSTKPIEYPSVRMILVKGGSYASFITDGTMTDFYIQLLNSTYIDWLSAEYSYNNRTIHRGTYAGTIYVSANLTSQDYGIVLRIMAKEIEQLGGDENTINMYHLPNEIKCQNIGGGNLGTSAFVFDCNWMRLPLRDTQFWVGVGFLVAFLLGLSYWPLLLCTTDSKVGKCRCGIDLSGKTIFHSFFITTIIVLFFVGGFIMAIAYVNNLEDQFFTGMAILYSSGGILALWLISMIPLFLSTRLVELRCCFNVRPKTPSLLYPNLIYGSMLIVFGICAGLLIGLSFDSNVKITASHELMEIISALSVGSSNTMTLANSPAQIGIGNYCQIFEWDVLIGNSGIQHYIQRLWSNHYQKCMSHLPNVPLKN